MLIPASLKPQPADLQRAEARRLFRESGASLIRWFSRHSSQPTPYWHVVCDRYDFDSLSRKARNQIRKARRECELRTLDAAWMAANAYGCYVSAFSRYRHGRRPISREYFGSIQRTCEGAPFHFLGAFVGGQLAGFAKCFVLGDYVALSAFRLDPEYKRAMPSYAMLDELLRTYVREQGKTLGNGFASVHDDTGMQEFLLKFSFRRVYCDLRLAYRPALALAVNALYPFRCAIDRLPSRRPIPAVKSLLRQESIRRTCVLPLTADAPRSA